MALKGVKRKPFSEETRKRMSEAHKGKHRPPEVIEKIRIGNIGRVVSQEERIHHSDAMKGRPSTFKGKHHTQESNEKNRQSHLGKTLSEETRKLLSQQRIGNKNTLGYKHTEQAKKNMGEHRKANRNGNWAGGISYEPYTTEFNRQLKELIRRRDNFTCQRCGIPENELNKKLTVHHIDYIKRNSIPSNLIALCHNCNNSVNQKRPYWTLHFTELLIRQGKVASTLSSVEDRNLGADSVLLDKRSLDEKQDS